MSATLEEEVAAARRTIGSDGYPMSIGEITNLYKEGELHLQPKFQRFFRWTEEQKSRLVESILMGIPIPSIFVSQRDDGSWELVDGLQRLSTLFQLQGVLRRENGDPWTPLVLRATKYLPALDGLKWELTDSSEGEDIPGAFTRAQRLDIKRSKIDVKIITRESSPEAKFDLFQRLNSYGSVLSAQELRTAALAAVSSDFVDFTRKLATQRSFKTLCRLSSAQLEQSYDVELVLRFLVLHAKPSSELTVNHLRDFNYYLDQEAMRLAADFVNVRGRLQRTFEATFNYLASAGHPDVFRARKNGKTRNRFLNTSFEVFALGLGFHMRRTRMHTTSIGAALDAFWGRREMQETFATGRSTEWRLSHFIPIGRELLK